MKKQETLPSIYVLGLPIVLVFANFLAHIHFTILGSPVYVSVLLYPLAYMILGLIIRKTNYKKALSIMAISLLAESVGSIITWAILNTMDSYTMIYAFLSLLICGLIFIFTYDFLIKTKKDTYMPVFLLLVLVNVIDAAFFNTIIEGRCLSISVLFRIVFVIVLPVILARQSKKN